MGSEEGFIDAESLRPGDKSGLNVFISDDAIRNDAVTYDLIINDERVLEGSSIEEDSNSEESEPGRGWRRQR